jgi:hypothetical protein
MIEHFNFLITSLSQERFIPNPIVTHLVPSMIQNIWFFQFHKLVFFTKAVQQLYEFKYQEIIASLNGERLQKIYGKYL